MLKIIIKKAFLIGISLILLTNCDKNNQDQVEVEPENLPLPLAAENKDKIEPGPYCFESKKNKENLITAQLLIASDYTVTGVIESFTETKTKQVNNNLEYREFLAGVLNEQVLEITINGEKETKTQSRKETWLLSLNSLNTSKEIYQKINCEKLIINKIN
jgi:hypothetical protein